MVLLLHNLFGGFARGAAKHLRGLAARNVDRTEYESWAASEFVPYWAQRISAAIVTSDARRCLRRLPGLKAQVIGAAAPARARAATAGTRGRR